VANRTKEFLNVWGITHRVSSAMNPHSNTHAELAVKSMTRLIRSNVGADWSLDNVEVGRALMQ
jgi:hypothetical protein